MVRNVKIERQLFLKPEEILKEIDKKHQIEKFENVNQLSKEKELEKKIKANY
jgi:hypothetical protein